MKKKNIWMAIVTDENEVVFSKVCPSEQKAEIAIVEYLRKNKEYDGEDFGYAFFWIGDNDLKLNLMVFDMPPEEFENVK